MAKIDYKKFPKQKSLPKMTGHATGVFYPGICVVRSYPKGAVLLIAADIDTLRSAWDGISNVPLDEQGCQRVVIFGHDAVTKDTAVRGGT